VSQVPLADLQDALAKAFGDRDELEQFAKAHLDYDGFTDLPKAGEAFALAKWAEARQQTDRLLRRARRVLPTSALRDLADAYLPSFIKADQLAGLVTILESSTDLLIAARQTYNIFLGPLNISGPSPSAPAIVGHADLDMVDILGELGKDSVPSGPSTASPFPILEFVHRLLLNVDALGHEVALREWLQGASPVLDDTFIDLVLVCRPSSLPDVEALLPELGFRHFNVKIVPVERIDGGWATLVRDALKRLGQTAVCLDKDGPADWIVEASRPSKPEESPDIISLHLFPILLPGVARQTWPLPDFLVANTLVVFPSATDQGAFDNLSIRLTGRVRSRTPYGPDPETKRPEVVLAELAEAGLVIFIGPAASAPPSGYDMVSEVLRECKLQAAWEEAGGTAAKNANGDEIWPILLPRDVAGQYVAFKRSPEKLKEVVAQLVRGSAQPIPVIHSQLACLLAQLSLRLKDQKPRTATDRRPLLVTTNLDLMIERALLTAGISFTRVVQVAQPTDGATAHLAVNDYHLEPIDENKFKLKNFAFVVPRRSTQDIEGAIRYANPIVAPDPVRPWRRPDVPDSDENDVRPILYKFHGSCDITDSCLLTSHDYDDFDLAHTPGEVLSRVRTSPLLFVGYNWTDPEFRHVRRTLLRGSVTPVEAECVNRYAIPILPKTSLSWLDAALMPEVSKQWRIPPVSASPLEKDCALLFEDITKILRQPA
jgi:hypothetical protein